MVSLNNNAVTVKANMVYNQSFNLSEVDNIAVDVGSHIENNGLLRIILTNKFNSEGSIKFSFTAGSSYFISSNLENLDISNNTNTIRTEALLNVGTNFSITMRHYQCMWDAGLSFFFDFFPDENKTVELQVTAEVLDRGNGCDSPGDALNFPFEIYFVILFIPIERLIRKRNH